MIVIKNNVWGNGFYEAIRLNILSIMQQKSKHQTESKQFLYDYFYKKHYDKLAVNDNAVHGSLSKEQRHKKNYLYILLIANFFFFGSLLGFMISYAFPWKGLTGIPVNVKNIIYVSTSDVGVNSIFEWEGIPVDQKQHILIEILIFHPESLLMQYHTKDSFVSIQESKKHIHQWVQKKFRVFIPTTTIIWDGIKPYELQNYVMLAKQRLKFYKKTIVSSKISQNQKIKTLSVDRLKNWQNKMTGVIADMPWSSKDKQQLIHYTNM